MTRPILFSTAMVQALLSGKTQTRRVVKPQPNGVRYTPVVVDGHAGWVDEHGYPLRCPYGEPGDRLWVRETWCIVDDATDVPLLGEFVLVVDYKADTNAYERAAIAVSEDTHERYTGANFDSRWRSSIHMPRWASRLTLTVADVRVERLQAISHEDALAEGCPDTDPGGDLIGGSYAVTNYARLWDELNGHKSACAFVDNPLAWVIEFERVKA